MDIAPKTITVEPDSEVARVLELATEAPILIETRGARYRVVREGEDPFATYDPERARAALDRVFGTLKGIDVDLPCRAQGTAWTGQPGTAGLVDGVSARHRHRHPRPSR